MRNSWPSQTTRLHFQSFLYRYNRTRNKCSNCLQKVMDTINILSSPSIVSFLSQPARSGLLLPSVLASTKSSTLHMSSETRNTLSTAEGTGVTQLIRAQEPAAGAAAVRADEGAPALAASAEELAAAADLLQARAVDDAASAARADEAAVALAARADLAVVRAATSLESARALAARVDDALAAYRRSDLVHQGRDIRARFAVDGIFPEPGATVMELEETNVGAYELFKDMVLAYPNLDASSKEWILQLGREHFNIVAPTGQPRNNAD